MRKLILLGGLALMLLGCGQPRRGSDPADQPAVSAQTADSQPAGNDFVGQYLDRETGEPNLEIVPEGMGFSVNVGIFRLTSLDDGVGKLTPDGLAFTATDANGNPIGGLVTLDGDTATVTFTDSTWPNLPNGKSYTYDRIPQTLPCSAEELVAAWQDVASMDEYEESEPEQYLMWDIDRDGTPEIIATDGLYTAAIRAVDFSAIDFTRTEEEELGFTADCWVVRTWLSSPLEEDDPTESFVCRQLLGGEICDEISSYDGVNYFRTDFEEFDVYEITESEYKTYGPRQPFHRFTFLPLWQPVE